ncbi:MAG: HDOD domain-containing protein [Planctomycetes bacterium]|nr:HDOD domain-containing protein [Planctomycetota bacterium]
MIAEETATEELLAQRVAIPSLPGALAAILATVDREENGAAEIAAALACDPGLCARALRLASSAHYGVAEPVTEVPRAVMTLGRTTIRRVVLQGAVLTCFETVERRDAARVERFWMRSTAAAHIARALTRLRVPDLAYGPEELYTAALLMDVGSLVLLDHDAARWCAVQQGAGLGDPRELERLRFGVDHAALGRALVEAWNLPVFVAEAAELHHGGPVAPAHASFAAVVRAAEQLADELVSPRELAPHAPALAAELGLAPAACLRALEVARREWSAVGLSDWLRR